MGAEERKSGAHLKERLRTLEHEAPSFSFYRLIYLLERLHPGAPGVGQLGPPSAEKIRLRGEPSLTFASSDVSEAKAIRYPDGVERFRVSASFMGLYGPVSPLPTHYAEQIALSEYQG